jgi:hypothetical protein
LKVGNGSRRIHHSIFTNAHLSLLPSTVPLKLTTSPETPPINWLCNHLPDEPVGFWKIGATKAGRFCIVKVHHFYFSFLARRHQN